MNEEKVILLLRKYREGNLSQEEKELLEAWYLLRAADSKLKLSDEELEQSFEYLKTKLPVTEKKVVRLWPRIAAVAAAVALIVLGVYFFSAPSRHLDDRRDLLASANDIAPGKNGATLTLANGKVIQLSDTKTGVVIGQDLKYSDNTLVIQSESEGSRSLGTRDDKNGEQLTAKTAKGQTYIFTLPDGTKVWLNAASSLTIPSGFSGTESRIVELSGEAYFEVAKNKKRPFIVESNGQEVTVLGTHFNISAYKDEGSVKTTLLEGSVRVASLSAFGGEMPNGQRGGKTPNSSLSQSDISPRGGERSIVLKPNQQSVVTGSNRISIKEVDAQAAVAWKEGVFIFDSTRLDQIMKQVARWYDVEVIYENPELRAELMGGSVSRYDKVSRILTTLQNTGAVKFRVEGRKVYVGK